MNESAEDEHAVGTGGDVADGRAPGGLRWYRQGMVWLVIVIVTAVAAWVFAGWAESNQPSALGAFPWLL